MDGHALPVLTRMPWIGLAVTNAPVLGGIQGLELIGGRMRWPTEKKAYYETWHLWFAWHPVTIGKKKVWLELVERIRFDNLPGPPAYLYRDRPFEGLLP